MLLKVTGIIIIIIMLLQAPERIGMGIIQKVKEGMGIIPRVLEEMVRIISMSKERIDTILIDPEETGVTIIMVREIIKVQILRITETTTPSDRIVRISQLPGEITLPRLRKTETC